jgi:hypothetical protein
MAKKKKEIKNETAITKVLKAIIVVLGIFVILVALVFLGAQLYFGVPVLDYYRSSEKAFVIPGLSDNMVPQGLDYLEEDGIALVGGYQNDASPSRIYKVNIESGESLGYVLLGDEAGRGIAPHAGGLAAHGEYVYVAGDEDAFVYVYKLDDVMNSEDGTVLKSLGKFYTMYGESDIRADFMCFTDDMFIVGEFYREPNYPTPDDHVFEWGEGDVNHALALCYRISDDEDARFGLEIKPCNVLSLPDQVQGIEVYDNKIWLSQSYATSKSTISCYNAFDDASNKYVDVKNVGIINVFALDSKTFVSSFEAPPMAEEIFILDGKMYIMCESASNKYVFGNFTGARWCYATDINKVT